MLGLYENFPQTIHKTTHFTFSISNRNLQQALVKMLHEINGKTFSLKEIAYLATSQCTVIFEFGIADASNFNYLDAEELRKIMNAAKKKPLQIMDFFCSLRYYRIKEKKTPLKFDYYFIRFIFDKNLMETQISHERGPRYVSPEELANLVVKKVNGTFSKKVLKELKY